MTFIRLADGKMLGPYVFKFYARYIRLLSRDERKKEHSAIGIHSMYQDIAKLIRRDFMPNDICRDFVRILGGTLMSSSVNSCVVSRIRDIDVTIMRRPSRSPLTLAAMFSYESPDSQGRTLNLGETVILPREVNPFIDVLRSHNIIVTALHNHWLFERPRLMYIHFESISDPLVFARNVAEAFETFDCRIGEEDLE